MQNLFKFLKKRHPDEHGERRRHPRYTYFMKVHYMVRDCWYKGYIQNISEGGAYIVPDLQKKVPLGEDILLVVELRVLLDQIKCKIVWKKSRGIGVAFDTADPNYSKLKALLTARCFS